MLAKGSTGNKRIHSSHNWQLQNRFKQWCKDKNHLWSWVFKIQGEVTAVSFSWQQGTHRTWYTHTSQSDVNTILCMRSYLPICLFLPLSNRRKKTHSVLRLNTLYRKATCLPLTYRKGRASGHTGHFINLLRPSWFCWFQTVLWHASELNQALLPKTAHTNILALLPKTRLLFHFQSLHRTNPWYEQL